MVRIAEMAHFEREYWQAHVYFGGAGTAVLGPREVARFLDALEALPLEGMQWQMPAFSSGRASLLELNIAGIMQSVVPDVVSGNSPTGWSVRFSAQQLVVRHQELVVDGFRQLSRDEFPNQQEFLSIANEVYSLLPPGLVPRRASMSVNYAMFTGESFAPSVLNEFMGRGPRCAAPPPDDIRFNVASSDLEFRTVEGVRFAISDITRLGNWFAPTGQLLTNSAIVHTAEIKTASPEPSYPVPGAIPMEALPELREQDVRAVIGPDGAAGLSLLLERLRRSLPGGFELDE
jgi:hypothetical protein